jgi:hypothetical protein
MSAVSETLPLPIIVGIVRIAFGAMFMVKLYFSIAARHMVWAHRRPRIGRWQVPLQLALTALAIALIAFTLGVFTGPAAMLQWALYLWLFRSASLYGLEDICFHTLCFYFVFAGAGEAWSLDAMYGTAMWGRLGGDSLIPELSLAAALGAMFLSAGVEKLRSPMWRQGMGAYYFFLLPNFRRCRTGVLTRRQWAVRVINYVAIVMELGLLPAMLFNAFPAGLCFVVLALLFVVQLWTVFVLTWIGESLTVAFGIVLWLILDSQGQSLFLRWIAELDVLTGMSLYVALAIALSIAAGAWVALCDAHVRESAGTKWYRPLHHAVRWLARHTWGLVPCAVFTEVHMQGPIVYRVFARQGESESEVFRIFDVDGGPGPQRRFRPAFFEVTSYKVAEACMELDRDGRIVEPQRLAFIQRLSEYIAGAHGLADSSLVFEVRQFIPPGEFAGADETWLEAAPWVRAFEVSLDGRKAGTVVPLSSRILRGPTGRDLKRLSFAFNPASN